MAEFAEFIIRPVALNQLLNYFKDPKNHLYSDKKHIAPEDFSRAVGKISPEVDRFIYDILDQNNGYRVLAAMQKEGIENDPQVSMRDMYAASRGYGYDGEPILVTCKSHAQFLGEISSGSHTAFCFTDGPLTGDTINIYNYAKDASVFKSEMAYYTKTWKGWKVDNMVAYRYCANKVGDKIIKNCADIWTDIFPNYDIHPEK